MILDALGQKQAKACIWWKSDKYVTIAEGAIRTGKTLFTSIGLLLYAHLTIKEDDAPTKGSNTFFLVSTTDKQLESNIIEPLEEFARANGWSIEAKKHKYVYKKQGVLVNFMKYSADNSTSFKRIQGGTFRGGLIDEAPLIDLKMIQTAIDRCITFRDRRICLTGNPEGGTGHPFYQKYLAPDKVHNYNHIHFELLDNPIFNNDDVAEMRSTMDEALFKQRILGLWVQPEGAVYKSFKREEVVKAIDYSKLYIVCIGVDYGETDATVFTATSISKDFKLVQVLSTYYHKNGSGKGDKDINGYVADFITFVKKVHAITGKHILVKVDSANKSFKQLALKACAMERLNYVQVESVVKVKQMANSKDVISERINITNMLLKRNSLSVSSTCTNLIHAFENALYHPDSGERLDNGTSDIDSLDSFEYSIYRFITQITNAMYVRDGGNNVK